MIERIKLWMFDMDHTLYPPGTGFLTGGMPEFTAIFVSYISKEHGMSEAEVYAKIKELEAYSQDPYALMKQTLDFDQAKWDAYACASRNYHVVPVNEEIRQAISALPGHKVVVTNAGRGHAEKMLTHLNVIDVFDDISYLEVRGMVSKPNPQVYQGMLDKFNTPAGEAVMVDDLPGHLKSAHEIGLQTALVYTPKPSDASYITYADPTLEAFLARARSA